ncbi:hypothetical protein [Nitratifractor sp.]
MSEEKRTIEHPEDKLREGEGEENQTPAEELKAAEPSEEKQSPVEGEKSFSESSAEEAVKEEKTTTEEEPVETDKNRLAQKKVEEARRKVQSAEEEIEECLRNIEEDLHRFEEYERESLLPVVDESRALLERIDVGELPETEKMVPSVELISPEEDKPTIRDLSPGKGGALFLALLGGILTLLGWYLFAAKKAGLTLLPQGQPDMTLLNKLSAAISEFFGQGANASVGMAIVVISTLVVMWLIYTIFVAVRASKNIHEAEKVEEAAGFYCRKKEECKEMMKRVREHLETLDQTVRKYEVVLHEQNAALRRAFYIEKAENFDDLHDKSKKTVRELQDLLRELDRLLETPMARSGMLTEESVEALRHAKRTINDHILRLYS